MVKKQEKLYVIIVAAGSGTRFGGDIPKQFVVLGKRPVLMHCIDNFRNLSENVDITLVLSHDNVDYWNNLCHSHGYESPMVVCGGASRTESVKNAIGFIKNKGIERGSFILIQDGARPFLDESILENEILSLLRGGQAKAVVPSLPLTDSIMTNSPSDAQPADRNLFVRVQTPQAFDAFTLIEAYDKMPEGETMTDDASVVARHTGENIYLAKGWESNIKITHKDDIAIAELILSQKADSNK